MESFGFGVITPLKGFQKAMSILRNENVLFYIVRSSSEAGLELLSNTSMSLYSGITSASRNAFGGMKSGVALWNGGIMYCPMLQQDGSLSQLETISLETSSTMTSTSVPEILSVQSLPSITMIPTVSSTSSIPILTSTPKTRLLPRRDKNWVVTDKETYAKGERIVVMWNNLDPSVGDNIVVSFVDPDHGWFIAKIIRPICEEEGCLSTAHHGAMEINPEPELAEDTYYVSLYNKEEISYATFNVIDRTIKPTLSSLRPTSSPSSQPTSSPSTTPTMQPTQNPSIHPTLNPSSVPTSSSYPTQSPSKRPTKLPTFKFVSEDSVVTDKKNYNPGEYIHVAYYRKEPEIGDTVSLSFFDEEMGWFVDVVIRVVCEHMYCASGPQQGVIEIKLPLDLAQGEYYISFYSADQKEVSFTKIFVTRSNLEVVFPKQAPQMKSTQTPSAAVLATNEYGKVKSDEKHDKLEVNMVEASRSFSEPGDSIEYSWYTSNPEFGDKVAVSYYDDGIQSYKLVDVQYLCMEKTEECEKSGKNIITPWPSLTPGHFYLSLVSSDNKEMDYDSIVVT